MEVSLELGQRLTNATLLLVAAEGRLAVSYTWAISLDGVGGR